MKPYHRYKPTGLAWLPYVPEHWEVVKIKRLFSEVDERNRDLTAPLLSFSRTKGILPFSDVSEKDPTAGDLSLYKILRPGLLLENRLQAWSGMFAASDVYGCVSPDYSVFRPRSDINVHFYEYVFRSPFQVKQFANASRGVGEGFNRLYTPQFGAIETVLPPPSEQDRIVRYLDAKTAAIDELVRAKEREIELLRERKQALITAAVTGGLGPATERKDSGIPWIGKIPKHWTVAKTGHLFKMLLGKMLANSATSPKDTFERYACAKDVHFSGIDTSDLKEMWFSPEEKALLQTRQGDLLIVEGGAGAGGAAIVEDDGGYCIQNSIHLLRSKHELGWTPFLKYWMFSLVSRGYIDHVCNKATIPHFTKDKVFNMPLPLPPLPEQRRIVEHLDNVCSELAAAEAAIRKQITLLQELRTRLVSDAVTGAVEV